MNRFKLAALATLTLCLATAATALEDPIVISYGESSDKIILQTQLTEFDAAGECAVIYGDGDTLSAACEGVGSTQIV